MRRPLSTIEQLIDGNITCVVGVEGRVTLERLRFALAWLQRRHPALRMLIGGAGNRRYYELDAAGAIPLRVVERGPRASPVDGRRLREIDTEVSTAFGNGQPPLRVVWLMPADGEPGGDSELLVTAPHRVCDGMSILTVIRELLRALHSDDAPVPYPAITTADIIGTPERHGRWKRRLAATLVNLLIALVPPSRRALRNRELHLEWAAGRALSSALVRRCKAEGVSIHAVLLLVLREALQSVLGQDGPDSIECPVDARRGRLPALGRDMLFFGGGSFRVDATSSPGTDFWADARAMSAEIRARVEQDVAEIPARYQLCEMVRPPSPSRVRSIVRLGDALSRNGNWNRFSFSNLGNIVLNEETAPVRVRRFSLHVHSFATRVLGFIAFSLHGRLHFIYTGDERCLDPERADALGRALIATLQRRVGGHAHSATGAADPVSPG